MKSKSTSPVKSIILNKEYLKSLQKKDVKNVSFTSREKTEVELLKEQLAQKDIELCKLREQQAKLVQDCDFVIEHQSKKIVSLTERIKESLIVNKNLHQLVDAKDHAIGTLLENKIDLGNKVADMKSLLKTIYGTNVSQHLIENENNILQESINLQETASTEINLPNFDIQAAYDKYFKEAMGLDYNPYKPSNDYVLEEQLIEEKMILGDYQEKSEFTFNEL